VASFADELCEHNVNCEGHSNLSTLTPAKIEEQLGERIPSTTAEQSCQPT